MLLNEINFFSHLNKFNCFEKYPNVAVGVSGGPDSIALAYLLDKWIRTQKGKLQALIFDHRLRPNSKEESLQVKKNLQDLQIASKILTPKKNLLIKKNMEQARNNRLGKLINFCNKNNILHLFLGHHFDDNLETYLIRKVNGSNFEGLGSMEEITYFTKIQIIRPFIKVKKKSIIKFNKERKLFFLDDPSNQDLKYTRVKVRNYLNTNQYNKFIKHDFIKIKKEIPHYKDMIWSIFIEILIHASSKKIKLNRLKLIEFDKLIMEKIVLLCLKYFSYQNYKARSSKIIKFINEMIKPNFKFYDLGGVLIRNREETLIFSQK